MTAVYRINYGAALFRGVTAIRKAALALKFRKLGKAIKKHGGVDILVTHAPARGVNDFDSISHRGFEAFAQFIETYRPAYMVHGHIHKNYGRNIPQISNWNGTVIINAYDHCAFHVGGTGNGTTHDIR